MAANLGFIPDAAQADTNEVAAHCRGDGAAQAGLPDTRWANETEDLRGGRACFGRELAHCQEIEDALLDGFQTKVLSVQQALGLKEVELILGSLVPRQGQNGIEIGANHRRLSGDAGHALETRDFFRHPVCG